MLPDPGANIALQANGLSGDLFAAGSILHVSGYSLMRPGSRAAALVAMDKGSRRGHADQRRPRRAPRCCSTIPAFLDRARPVDLLLPNEDEFAALGGDLPGVKMFVIKRGT